MKHANHLAALAPRITELHAALLRDWDDPTLNEAELCERHGVTPDQLRALAARPDFAHDVKTLRAVREIRRPHVRTRSRDLVLARLCALIQRDPDSATQAKENRLAVKQLLTLLDNTNTTPDPREQRPAAERIDRRRPEARNAPPPAPRARTANPARSPAAALLAHAGGIPTSSP